MFAPCLCSSSEIGFFECVCVLVSLITSKHCQCWHLTATPSIDIWTITVSTAISQFGLRNLIWSSFAFDVTLARARCFLPATKTDVALTGRRQDFERRVRNSRPLSLPPPLSFHPLKRGSSVLYGKNFQFCFALLASLCAFSGKWNYSLL